MDSEEDPMAVPELLPDEEADPMEAPGRVEAGAADPIEAPLLGAGALLAWDERDDDATDDEGPELS
jgi:hypothetical protein